MTGLEPVQQMAAKPLITFFLFAYNQEKYIEEACRSALAQTYSPLEIILSDDCSTDRTFEIIRTIAKEYTGPHTVIINRNEFNLGLVGHVNKAFLIATGEIIIAAAGDDISMPERTAALASVFAEPAKPLLVHSDVTGIDISGALLGDMKPPIRGQDIQLEKIAKDVGIYIGASGAWRKELYTIFGPITEKNAFEDGVFGFRAALFGRIKYVEKPLVLYRKGIGLSSFSRSKSLRKSFIVENRRKTMLNDLMRQRYIDLCRLDGGLNSLNIDLIKIVLRNEIVTIKISFAFYNNPIYIIKSLLMLRLRNIKAALKNELTWILASFKS